MTPLLSFTLGAILALLAVPDGAVAEPVFVSEDLIFFFGTLKTRQCLPDNFDASEVAPRAKAIREFIRNPDNVPEECSAAPILAVFFNTFASSFGFLDADATSFDVSAVEASRNSYSDDPRYRGVVSELFDRCGRSQPVGMSARQHAVYTLLCFHWSLFADCDIQQTDRNELDDSGLLRRASFFTGSCPTSPDSLKNALQKVTGRSVEECRQGLYSGDDEQKLYDAGVSLVTCLLQDFTKRNGYLNIGKLRRKTSVGVLTPDAGLLNQVVTDCTEGTSRRGKATKITPAEFARCWATSGVFGCAIQEAMKVANAFPNDCAMTADIDVD